MGDLSKNFSRHEFACKCGCGFDTVDAGLLQIVQAVRSHFSRRVDINSACRCPQHNSKVGGSDKSQHLLGRAADIVVKGVNPAQVADYVNKMNPHSNGVGTYETFTHVDSRTNRERW